MVVRAKCKRCKRPVYNKDPNAKAAYLCKQHFQKREENKAKRKARLFTIGLPKPRKKDIPKDVYALIKAPLWFCVEKMVKRNLTDYKKGNFLENFSALYLIHYWLELCEKYFKYNSKKLEIVVSHRPIRQPEFLLRFIALPSKISKSVSKRKNSNDEFPEVTESLEKHADKGEGYGLYTLLVFFYGKTTVDKQIRMLRRQFLHHAILHDFVRTVDLKENVPIYNLLVSEIYRLKLYDTSQMLIDLGLFYTKDDFLILELLSCCLFYYLVQDENPKRVNDFLKGRWLLSKRQRYTELFPVLKENTREEVICLIKVRVRKIFGIDIRKEKEVARFYNSLFK